MQEFLDEMVSSRKVAGCAAAVYRGGKCLFRGFAGVARADVPVGEHTAFRLASMTKPVTAVAALLCVQDGLFSLDDSASKFLPAFGKMRLAVIDGGKLTAGGPAGEFTLRQLLTHSAGIGAGEAGEMQYAAFCPRDGDTLATAVERYAGMLMDFRPGTAQFYSAVVGLDIVARIVELASGISYGEFVHDRIFAPLGMEETSYLLTGRAWETIASNYRAEGGELIEEEALRNFNDFPLGYTGGGAGLLSTLGDYVRFAEMLRRARKGEREILTQESAIEMSKPQLDESIGGIYPIFNWGLGVRALSLRNEDQPLTAGSFGWSGAFGTHFWVDPANDLTAVYMHNSSTYGGAGAPHTLAFERAVMREFLD